MRQGRMGKWTTEHQSSSMQAEEIPDRLRPEWRQHLPLMTATASKSILNCQQANYRPLTATRKKRPPLDCRANKESSSSPSVAMVTDMCLWNVKTALASSKLNLSKETIVYTDRCKPTCNNWNLTNLTNTNRTQVPANDYSNQLKTSNNWIYKYIYRFIIPKIRFFSFNEQKQNVK